MPVDSARHNKGLKTMRKNDNNTVLSAQEAARYLAAQLGGDVRRWRTWLANDRRTGRAGALPPLSGPGRSRYIQGGVDAYIAAGRDRYQRDQTPAGRVAEVLKAMGLGEAGGSIPGRRLSCQVLSPGDSATGERLIRLVIAKPLLVYRLGLEQAREIADQLLCGVADSERGHGAKLGVAAP